MNEAKIERGKDKITLILPVEVDHHILSMMRHSLDTMLFEAKPSQLLIDFSAVELMDSSAIGLILGRFEICKKIGAKLCLFGLSARSRRLLELGGVMRVQGIDIR